MCFKKAGLEGGAAGALLGVMPVFYPHSSIWGFLKPFFK